MKEEYYQLEAIETIINKGDLATAKKQLKKFQFEEYYLLTPFVLFLQGRIFYEEDKWEKAEKKFKSAIKLCKEYKLNPKDNLISACYKELASCCYKNNDLNQAITYVNLGLEAYDETKERKEIKYHLLGNKTLYLLKSSRADQASRLLDQVWPEVEKVDSSYDDYSVLNLYKFRSTILRDQKTNKGNILLY